MPRRNAHASCSSFQCPEMHALVNSLLSALNAWFLLLSGIPTPPHSTCKQCRNLNTRSEAYHMMRECSKLHGKQEVKHLTRMVCRPLILCQIIFYFFQVFCSKSPLILSRGGWHFGTGSFPSRTKMKGLLARCWQGPGNQSFREFLS